MDTMGREEYLEGVLNVANRTKVHGRPIPFSLIGNVDNTTLCHIEGVDYNPSFDVTEHVLATAIITGQNERILNEIYLSDNLEVKDVKVTLCKLSDLESKDYTRVQEIAKDLAQKRIDQALKGGKIGRNQFCPCGSGKKYKNCCSN